MSLTPLHMLSESLVEFNRERVKNEFAQGIYDLMRLHRINRKQLADLLGIQKSLVSRMLSGGQNFRLETLADIYLVLGRTPHLTLGADFDEIRFPHDECVTPVQSGTTTTRHAVESYRISEYRGVPRGHETMASSRLPDEPMAAMS